MAAAHGAPSHYSVLGVAPDASLAVIRAAFRARALETHPDKAGAHGADKAERSSAFDAVRSAWGVLSDPEKRAQYDSELLMSRSSELRCSSEVSIDDMEPGEEEGTLVAPCRCGGQYVVDEAVADAADDDLIVECASCSLRARIVVNPQ